MDFVAGYYFFVNGDEEGRRSLFVGCRDNLRARSTDMVVNIVHEVLNMCDGPVLEFWCYSPFLYRF